MKKMIEMKTGTVVIDSDEIQIAEETLTPAVDLQVLLPIRRVRYRISFSSPRYR